MIAIRTPESKPFTKQRVTLDGQDFVLTFEWNMRSGWYLGLADQDGVSIFAPKKMVPDWDLLEFETDDRRPRGALFLADTSGRGEKATYESLGLQHLLIYATEAEAAEALAEVEVE